MNIVALDTETALFGPGNMAPPLTCVSLANSTEVELLTIADNKDMRRWLLSLFKNKNTAIVGHNIAYDMGVLCAEYPDLEFVSAVFDLYYEGRVLDTMTREKLIDIAAGPGLKGGKGKYSLATIAKDRLGLEMDKDTHRLTYGELRNVPQSQWPAGAALYALDDATATLMVYNHQQAQADDYLDGHALVNELEQTRGDFALHLQSVYGIRTDRASIDAVEATARAKYDALKEILIKAKVLTLKSPKHPERGYRMGRKFVTSLVEDACEDMGMEVPVSEKGNVKTDRMTLNDTHDELLMDVALFKEQEKILSTYVPLLRRGQDEPLHNRYSLANTGRVSSSPNQQNWPRGGGLRECIVPRPGYVFCSVDFDTAELRALSAFCEQTFGYSRMAEVLRAGEDPHLMLAATLLGITVEEAKKRKNDIDVKDARNLSKQINFGLPGGMGARTFVLTCKRAGIIITERRAKELKALWLQTWPEMVEFFQYAALATNANGGKADIVTPWSNRLRADCFYSEFCNQHFQGPVSDAAKAATFALAYECYTGRPFPGVECDTATSPLFGSRPMMFIHDENIAELPEAAAADAAWRMAKVMGTVGSSRIPLVPLTCSPALMLRLSKGASTVYNEQGELTVWKSA